MADGSIRIETKLDNSALKKQLKELERELANAEKEYADLEKKFNSESAKYQKRINKGGRDGSQAEAEQLRLAESIGKQQDTALKNIEKYKQKLAEATSYYERMSAASDASNQVDRAMADDKFVSGIQSQEQYNSLLAKSRSEMASIEAHAARISAKTGASVNDILRQNDAYRKAAETVQLLETRSSDISANIRRTKAELRAANRETKKIGDSTKHSIMGFGKMGLALMAVRFAMRAISAATREYMATNSQLEGQMNTLKALWGQVLGPAIEWVITLFIKAISVVNAFVVALSGINLIARANTAALNKQNAAAGGAAKQNQLAGFDEQTKLSDSGGGGGGATATLPDGTTMDLSFLDPLMEAIRKFKEDISPLIGTVGELFRWLWTDILVPLGNWALNGVLPGFLNILGGAFLVLNDALLTIQPVAKWLWDNVLQPIAEWTGGVIVDVLNAIGDWIHEHHETLGKVAAVLGVIFGAESLLGAATTILPKVATALGTLLTPANLIIAAIAGLIAIFVTCYDECEGFRKGMDKVWEGIKKIFFAGVDFVKALFKGDWAGMDEAWERIEEAAASLWEGLVEGLKAGWEWAKEKVAEIWNKIIVKFKEIFGIHSPSALFRDFGNYMMEGLVNGIKNAISKVTNACREIWTAIKNVFSVVGTWFKDTFTQAWTNVKNVFSTGGKIFDGITEGIAATFKTIVNGIISGINKVIRVPFNAINTMLNKIKQIKILGITPFFDLWGYSPLSVPQIPMLARGGIVNRPGRGVPAIIGEAGAEAVLPLDNHTEWMDILADKISGGNVTIPITLDGKRIATYIVDIQRKKAFAANGA